VFLNLGIVPKLCDFGSLIFNINNSFVGIWAETVERKGHRICHCSVESTEKRNHVVWPLAWLLKGLLRGSLCR